jgi:hypothetical protein
MSDMHGLFVFSVEQNKHHVPFTMTQMDDGRVKVVFHTEKYGHDKAKIDMHISTLLKGKRPKYTDLVLQFYVTSQEFENFKNNVIDQNVEWVVAREPFVIPKGSGLIDAMHKTVDKVNAMFADPPGPVTIHGTWISHDMGSMGSMGGRRRSYKKRSSHKKRKSQKKCSSHKNHKRSSSKSHRRRHH